jgi:threonine dehydrogenase-like Zn-dependent dehydrogenase
LTISRRRASGSNPPFVQQMIFPPGDFVVIIRHIEDGRIHTRPWITHHASFDEMIEVFPEWLKPESGVIKAVFSASSRISF